MDTSENKDFSLEEKLREIRSLLDQMQTGTMDFDENVKLFTQGTGLIDQCRTYLDQAEMRIQQLIERNGEDVVEEFE